MYYDIEYIDENVKLCKVCNVTGEEYCVTVPHADYLRWFNKEDLIQDIFPDLTAEQREFIMTGYTPDEWGELWGQEMLDD